MNNPRKPQYSPKTQNFYHHLTAQYTGSDEKFITKTILSYPLSNYGIKGAKKGKDFSKEIFELKRARNEKNLYYRPYTAPQKEKILLNLHLLKTQDYKEILIDKKLKDFEDSMLEDLNLSRKSQIMRKSEQIELINNCGNSDFQRSSGFRTLQTQKDNLSYFVTGIDTKEDFLKKFPLRPQSSHVILQKKCKGLIKRKKKEEKDLSGGFFDCEKGQFIRKKIIETPAILFDITRKVAFEKEAEIDKRQFPFSDIYSQKTEVIMRNRKEKPIYIETRKAYTQENEFYRENKIKSGFNVSKLNKN